MFSYVPKSGSKLLVDRPVPSAGLFRLFTLRGSVKLIIGLKLKVSNDKSGVWKVLGYSIVTKKNFICLNMSKILARIITGLNFKTNNIKVLGCGVCLNIGNCMCVLYSKISSNLELIWSVWSIWTTSNSLKQTFQCNMLCLRYWGYLN